MRGADDAEVPVVEGCDGGDVEALRCSDDRGIGGAEREVAVLGKELADAGEVRGVDGNDDQLGGLERGYEAKLRAPSQAIAGEVGRLGQAQRRQKEGPGVVSQRVQARSVLGVLGIQNREQRTGVN